MHDREPKEMKRLLERLLAARARRDREERFSEAWRAADAEMHAIERAIFRVPVDGAPETAESRSEERGTRAAGPSEPTPFHRHAPSSRTEMRRYDAERAG
jgi:hypothetical protein